MAYNFTSVQQSATEVGDTFISIVERGGHIYAVDQHGKLINGLLSVTATSAVDSFTEAVIKVGVFPLNGK